jgi:hypothetical protein
MQQQQQQKQQTTTKTITTVQNQIVGNEHKGTNSC